MSLDDKSKNIILFVLTNDKIPVLPVYKISPQEIAFYCGTTTQKSIEVISNASEFGIYYIDGFIIIEDLFTRAKYTGGKTQKARERLWNSLPSEIKDLIDIDGCIAQSLGNRYPMHGSNNHISITNNNKPITEEPKKEKPFSNLESITGDVMNEIAISYKMPIEFIKQKNIDMQLYCSSKGKTYKDYKAALMNWCRRDWEQSKHKYFAPVKPFDAVVDIPLTDEQRLQARKSLEAAQKIFSSKKIEVIS